MTNSRRSGVINSPCFWLPILAGAAIHFTVVYGFGLRGEQSVAADMVYSFVMVFVLGGVGGSVASVIRPAGAFVAAGCLFGVALAFVATLSSNPLPAG